MAKYKRTNFEEDDVSSNGSVPAETPSLGPTRIVYYPGFNLWGRRSNLEKFLLIFSLVLLLLVIVLSSTISIIRNRSSDYRVVHVEDVNKSTTAPQYCLSKQCITVTSSIINAIDHSVNPCENFYQYSCGGWIKNNPIPEGKSVWSTFGKLWQENELVMKNSLERNLTDDANSAERKAQIYYYSCLDRNGTIEKLGAEPIKDFIKKVGGWGISGEFDVTKWDFQKALQTLHNDYNMGGLFTWDVGEDDRNSSRHVIELDQGGLGLPARDYYLNKTEDDEVLQAYLKYMTQIGVLIGSDENSTRDQMMHVIEFETKLASITIPSADRRDNEKLYNKFNISGLKELAPFVDWLQYFNVIFKKVGRELHETDHVIVYAPDYLRNLSLILTNDYLSTDEGKAIVNNYLVWHMVRSLTSTLSKPFRDAAKILQRALLGSDGGEEMWRYCVSDTNNMLGFALGAMFVKEVFLGDSKGLAEQMIDGIRSAFKKNLEKIAWMDKDTKRLTREKVDAITEMIGFPEFILDPNQLNEKYSGLQVVENDFFNNNLRLNKFALKKNVEKLDQPVNKTRWGMTPPTVNAYYTPNKNQIVFPAGILQAPFYDTNYPRSINYGAMGVVMGHELTHAFDDEGREYDKYGNLNQWWKNSTIEKFNERAQCLIDQYSNFSINNEHLNGRQALGENIADNGGLQAAFHAYENWVESNGNELPLPGANLTHTQLFFVSFAQVWCSSTTKAAAHLQILNDQHTASQYRVMGSIANSYDFAKHFNCPAGSPMNPVKKCEIW